MSQSMGQYVDIDLYGSIGVETDCTKRQLTQAFDAEVLETLPVSITPYSINARANLQRLI